METRSKRMRSTESDNVPRQLSMNLRSQRPNYSIVIDFDEASREWNANKKKVGNGCYQYIHVNKQKIGVTTRSQSKNI